MDGSDALARVAMDARYLTLTVLMNYWQTALEP
jgi:hypothetical protein